MEKRQETERLPIHRHESDRMAELQHAVVSASVSGAAGLPEATSDVETESDDARLGPQERLGRSLHDKRDEVAMGLDEIVRITKIPKASLLHIEAGRFDSLPGDVFARGFLRSYARCVGLDGDEVVRRYAQCGLSPAPVSSELADAVLGSGRKQVARRARGTAAPQTDTVARTKPARAASVSARSESPAPDAKDGSADGSAVRKVLRDAFDLGLQLRGSRERNVPKNTSRTARADVQVSDESHTSGDVAASSCAAAREKRVRTFVPPSFDNDSDMTHRGPLTLGVIILVIVATLTMSYLLRRPGASTDGFTSNEPAKLNGAGFGDQPMATPYDVPAASIPAGAQRA